MEEYVSRKISRDTCSESYDLRIYRFLGFVSSSEEDTVARTWKRHTLFAHGSSTPYSTSKHVECHVVYPLQGVLLCTDITTGPVTI